MADGLIGYTGFVGGTLLRDHSYEGLFNSKNIEEIAGREFETLVCAGAPAEKWKANQSPDIDRLAINRLCSAIAKAKAQRVVLISTVDVYPNSTDVDELTPIDSTANHAYGRHRRELEVFLTDHFETQIVRLPGLFGRGLKKNAIYDLLHNNQVENINPESVFQFYDMSRLTADLATVDALGLSLVNLVPEPTSMGEIAQTAFDRELPLLERPAARYDVHTRYANQLGGSGAYLESATAVLQRIKAYVESERARNT